jgi:repressor LexA
MNQTPPSRPPTEDEHRQLREASTAAQELLREAARRLQAVLRDESIREEIPAEAEAAIAAAASAIGAALLGLHSAASASRPSAAPLPGGPTRQQGQFLAFIREYMLQNEAGVAPTHAVLQRFFNLTAPSVNSMLIRLEQRGFIRRIPRTARAIELILHPDLIPRLERRIKF